MPSKLRSRTITRDPGWIGPAIVPGENRLNEIVLGKRSITADTAIRLARLLFSQTPCGSVCP